MLINHELAADFSDELENDYREYAQKTNLPSKQFSCTGGSTSLSFVVWKQDAETFASAIYDLIYPILLKTRIKSA